MRAIILILASISVLFGANSQPEPRITWGAPVLGLRLGLQRAGRDLHVLLDNVGSTNLTVFVAMESGTGTDYRFQYLAGSPNGEQYPIMDLRPESNHPSAGLILPVSISLSPGEKHEFVSPLEYLDYLSKGRKFNLETMLQQGYRVTVSLEVQQKHLDNAVMGGLPTPATSRFWTGRLTSSFGMAKPGL